MSYPGCGCGANWWSQTPRSICGSFELEDGETEDQGACSVRHVSISCAAPDLPVAQCEDDEYTTIYQPEDEDNPFAVSARLFDENCEAITDENGDDITLILTQME